jgi:lysophospholipase L1-like esterase
MLRVSLILIIVGSLSYGGSAQEQQLIAASQSGAASTFFNAHKSAFTISSDFYDDKECIQRDGLANFFKKAKFGKSLRVAFLGGSITRAKRMYREQTFDYIQSMFPKVSMEGINAGVSGSDADLGACRLGEQVLRHKPDLIFIEFAVNGGFEQGVEGIIRQVKKYDAEIDICLIYTTTSKQLEDYKVGNIPPGIQKMEKIAAHYAIPSIHMSMEPAKLANEGKLVTKGNSISSPNQIVFSEDGVHPLEAAGNLYAFAIARAMLKMKNSNSMVVRHLPKPLFKDNWEDAKMLSPLEAASFSNGWSNKETNRAGFAAYKEWFPYLMVAEKPGESLSFTFDGTMFGFFDIGGPEVGQLDLFVDGKRVDLVQKGTNRYQIVGNGKAQLNRFNKFCNNRYRGQFICIELPKGRHRIELKISSSFPDKTKVLGPAQLDDINLNPSKYNRSVIYLGKILLRGNLI